MKGPKGLAIGSEAELLSKLSPAARARNPHIGQDGPKQTVSLPQTPKTGQDGGKALPKGKQPNGTEQRFLDICAARQRRGELLSFRYEGIRLKWGVDARTGQSMFYKPDVFLQEPDGQWVCIETKGAHIYERDIVRFKGARAEWPEFRFEMHQWKQGEWSRTL